MITKTKNYYNKTEAAQYLELSQYEFQCLQNQGEIEQPENNNGGIRNYYTKEQLDRIKKNVYPEPTEEEIESLKKDVIYLRSIFAEQGGK